MENEEKKENTAVVGADGVFRFQGREYRCTLGKNGLTADKREGDWTTPIGEFKLLKIYYRPDKLSAPETAIPTEALAPDDGWCDDPADQNYNQPVKLPYSARHEELWRADDVYDIIGVLDYNYLQAVSGKGSAIFLHVAHENFSPTAGCIAIGKNDLLNFLREADTETVIKIG